MPIAFGALVAVLLKFPPRLVLGVENNVEVIALSRGAELGVRVL